MRGQIDIEQKGCELLGCWTHYDETLSNMILPELILSSNTEISFH